MWRPNCPQSAENEFHPCLELSVRVWSVPIEDSPTKAGFMRMSVIDN